MSIIKHGIITFLSIVCCILGTLADVVFIAALFNNMKIFTDNKLWIAAPVGEWGLAIIISLVGLSIMFSAGRRYYISFSKRKGSTFFFVGLWAVLGLMLAITRVTLAADAGLNQNLLFEAIILFLLYVIAGSSMFAISGNLVSKKEKDNALKGYATEEIYKLIEECTLIENEQNMFVSQIKHLDRIKNNSTDMIITKKVINSFRTEKGIIVSEQEIPYKYMK